MGAAAIKYQLILTTATGSLALFRTRQNHSVLYEGYEGLYQRLCLCVDNESTKQAPESIPAQGINSNGDDDESVCHYIIWTRAAGILLVGLAGCMRYRRNSVY